MWFFILCTKILRFLSFIRQALQNEDQNILETKHFDTFV